MDYLTSTSVDPNLGAVFEFFLIVDIQFIKHAAAVLPCISMTFVILIYVCL